MEEESRHSISSRLIFDITMSSISLKLCEDTLTAILASAVNVHDIKPAHKPTILDTPLPTPNIATIIHERHHKLTPKYISQKWNIGLNTAKKTIKVTNQLGVRSALGPLTWRYCTDMMQQNLRRLNTKFYTKTLFAKCKCIIGNNIAQVYTDGQGFVHVDPNTSKSLAGLTLDNMNENIGIPNTTINDGTPEQVGPNSDFQKTTRKWKICGHQCEPYSQWKNRAEDSIRELKRRWKRCMIKRRAPKRDWDFGMVYESKILSRISRGHDGRTGMERIKGDTVDISKWTEFEFYILCWY